MVRVTSGLRKPLSRTSDRFGKNRLTKRTEGTFPGPNPPNLFENPQTPILGPPFFESPRGGKTHPFIHHKNPKWAEKKTFKIFHSSKNQSITPRGGQPLWSKGKWTTNVKKMASFSFDARSLLFFLQTPPPGGASQVKKPASPGPPPELNKPMEGSE